MILEVLCIFTNILYLLTIAYILFKIRQIVRTIKGLSFTFIMDEIVQLLNDPSESGDELQDGATERLAAVAAGGCAKKYLGKDYSSEEIEKMDENEIKKLYRRYEARLGHDMVKSLGSSIVCVLIRALKHGLTDLKWEIDSEDALQKDLEQDPFLSTALSGMLCEIYYKYGNYLAPVSAALITTKHIKEKDVALYNDGCGGSSDESEQ